MYYPNFVKERLHGGGINQRAMCHICPLQGQRKVGHDGPVDSNFLGIYEAPGEDEEADRLTRGAPFGRPLQGKTGYFMRVRHLAHVGLQQLVPNPRKSTSPLIGRLHIHLMNVMMCRPPENNALSKEGKHAYRCCANGARWFINRWLAENPDRTILPNGGVALSLIRGVKTPIEPYRGRPTMLDGPLEYEDERDIEKYVLRGVKPKEEWWPDFEVGVKHLSKLWKKLVRTIESGKKKQTESSFLEQNPWLTEWTKLWKKQKASLGRAAKREATTQNGAQHEDTTQSLPGTPTSTVPRAPRKRKPRTATLPLPFETPTPQPETGKTALPES